MLLEQPADPDAAATEIARLAAVRRYDILDSPPDGAFDRVCRLAARWFDVPVATVTIVDEDRTWFKACHGIDAVEIPREPGLCASAILQDEPYVISNALMDPRSVHNSLVNGELGVRFYAGAPITTADGFRLGTVNVLDAAPREITEADMHTLCDLAAIVMDELELRIAAMREVRREREHRDRAYRDQHHAERLARTLQRSLSPPTLPDVPGLDVAVRYRPFSAHEIGGDFYDLFGLRAGRWGFFLGDVCGKGPAAASLTSLARYTLRAAAMHDDAPAAILGALNSALLMDSTDMPMCSAVYGEIATTGGDAEFVLAVAGHPPPLIVRASGRVEPATAHGTVLGAFADVAFDSCRLQLEPGDALVLYSDGLLDVRLDGVPVDEARLAAILAGGAQRPAQELIALLDGMLQRLDEPPRDDVAVMAISRPQLG